MFKQEYGWWNVVITKGNRKIVVLINVHRTVDSESSGMKSYEAQYERAIGTVKRSRKIRNTQLKELAKYVKKSEGTGLKVASDFNESVCSANMQNFMNETGSFDMFQ